MHSRQLSCIALSMTLLAPAIAFAAAGLQAQTPEISAATGFRPQWDAPGSRTAASRQGHSLARAALATLPEDAAWEGFVTPAVAGGFASAEYHGKLVLWGGIAAAGHQAAAGVVLWDGTQFETLPPVSTVRALTLWNDQIVVAARASNNGPFKILALNGSAWDTLGTPSNGVNAMTVWSGKLVIVGLFTSIDGVPANNVAVFDGVGWSALGNGLGGGLPPYSVVDHAGTLVVGGQMSALHFVVRWDPVANAWQTLGAGLDGYVYGLASDGTNLFAAGEFSHSGSTPVSGVARWDGAAWNSVGLPAGAQASGKITIWNGKAVFAYSNPPSRLMAWDGVGLSALPGDSIGFNFGGMPSNSSGVGSVGTWGTSLVVTGTFFRNGSVPVPGILLYDGTQWSTLGEAWDGSQRGPGPGDITDMRAWGGSLVVAGQFGLVSDQDHYAMNPGIVAWDGTHWSGLGSGLFGTQIWLGEYQGDLIAAGWLTEVRSDFSLQRVVRWNGLTWSGFGTGAPDFATSIQQFGNDLYIGSDYGLYKWNGTAWSNVPGTIQVFALGTTVDSLVVGGSFDGTSGPTSPNVAFWDGASWRAAGAGVNGIVYATANWNGRVVIGGYFTASGANPLPGVAVWDGANWQPLGDNVVAVDRLRMFQGELLASGDFRLPDNTVVETVARYIGPDWQLLGSGSNNYVFEGFNGDLYQAGTGIVHGHVAHSLARRALAPVLAVPQPESGPLALSASPNPCGRLVRLSFTLPTSGRVRLTLHDVSGREVARPVDRELEAGTHQVAWPTGSAPGIYFVRLQSPGGNRTGRFVVLGN